MSCAACVGVAICLLLAGVPSSAVAKTSLQRVSAWGGYVFIINLIPLHVFVLLLMQRYSRRVYIARVINHRTPPSSSSPLID
ncbi:hypothetical protein JZ751_009666 [Albula glossodonta]|uniref:dolichyl-diphosphooligosaccharide--protein glycotransferase n=1 Tax=Albula glossodonta TaxID=121402 RepID=A0A8T2NVZ1_9TELE|nr:hypothetical protein JZ751_009666 [Albula glossodonta]